ncbi:hypothetical protein V495_07901 [Pseudogymnoascus sp. VKM F-4514 (FW-929)]|nr:hypothetical protein V495_07901 [Pseudogymnoascus sp. VKM F-4514 (FW-929)]KFY58867.1 hypothetical protein V497_04583 [Pseudogymnoascus sp. VKM F-4516 (FW-969)]
MSQQAYSHHHAPAPHRQPASHSTSSTFSSSANPEDWTQISGRAERRRMQNRIAQRNYRKKLKRRLDDLERRASVSSTSLPRSYTKLKQTAPNNMQNTSKQSSASHRTELSPRATYQHFQHTPPLQSNDNLFPLDRDHSITSPLFSYDQYTPSDDPSFYTRYTPPYRSTDNYDYALMTLPERHNDLNAFGMSYAAMTGLDTLPQCDDQLMQPLCNIDIVDDEQYAPDRDQRGSWSPSSPL